jgi:LmbE family N-acetylglucosaminyl deacetylase
MHFAMARAPFDRRAPNKVRTRLLADRPVWSPEDGPLLVVAPHPYDEVLGAGGLIHAWAARGAEVSVLSVSDGEAADPDWRGLGSVRREELTLALRKLCRTHVSVTRLGLPDGGITRHLNRLRNAILSLARGKSTLIAPYERDGHPDREAVGRVCLDVARSQHLSIARYAVWARNRTPRETPGEARWVRFVLSDDARRAKAHAVECFRSQIGPLHRDLAAVQQPYEAFLL